MMTSIDGADYSHRYRLQPIPLLISPITGITDVSVCIALPCTAVQSSQLIHLYKLDMTDRSHYCLMHLVQ